MRFCLIFFVCLFTNCLSQDYTNYYNLVNQAEKQFVEQRDSSCFNLYDKAFAANTPFIKDTYIASQIAYWLNDSTRFFNYIGCCFELGMPLTSVDASPLLRKGLSASERRKIKRIFEEHFNAKEVDSSIYTSICQFCYQSDSIKMTMGVDPERIAKFYASENAARDFILESYLKNGFYFNEHLLPITSDQGTKHFLTTYNKPDPYAAYPPQSNKLEWELRVICPFNILLHSHCFFQQNKAYLIEAVKKGYLHPKEYAILEETSIMWYKKDENKVETCPEPKTKTCYNILGATPFSTKSLFTQTKEGLEMVEANRKSIFLQSYSIDLAKKNLEKEYGFTFFFDFIDRP